MSRRPSHPRRRRSLRFAAVLAVGLVSGPGASGSTRSELTYPGRNGAIAFAHFRYGHAELRTVSVTRRVSGSLLRRAEVSYTEPSWSSDGRSLAFAGISRAGLQGIHVSTGDGRRIRRLTGHVYDPASPLLDAHPRWSPDGRRILFHRSTETTSTIYVMRRDGSGLRSLGSGFEPGWSPDGRRIVFTDRRNPGVPWSIYVMGSDGRGRVRLGRAAGNENGPDWSPDGRRIVFTAETGRNIDVYVMDADSTNRRRLTRAPGADVAPVWSPDARKIAYANRDRLGQFDLYVMNADGTGKTQLTRTAGDDSQPSWRPIPSR